MNKFESLLKTYKVTESELCDLKDRYGDPKYIQYRDLLSALGQLRLENTEKILDIPGFQKSQTKIQLTNEYQQPFENDPDADQQLTVAMLRAMLAQLPPEFDNSPIKYDGACGVIHKGEFVIYCDGEISING